MTVFPEYKTVSVASLIPYARNSRTHSDAQVGKIAASIRGMIRSKQAITATTIREIARELAV